MSSNSDMSGSEVGHKKQKSESGELFFTISNSTPTHHFKTSAQGWCTGKTQRDGMGSEAGRGIRMRNTCISMADSFQCMAKTTTIL